MTTEEKNEEINRTEDPVENNTEDKVEMKTEDPVDDNTEDKVKEKTEYSSRCETVRLASSFMKGMTSFVPIYTPFRSLRGLAGFFQGI